MVKNITLFVLLTLLHLTCLSQVSISEDQYNGFSSRSFMQFNNFMTVPTFSILHRETATIEAITRSANIEFEDASRLHILSYSGKMQRNVGAGIAVFQQEIGVFKDFGAVANYAYQLKLAGDKKLTFGFNFFYSRRSIDNPRVLSNGDDPLINNYQDKPVVVFQPAATMSFGDLDVGIFFENLGDFNLKSSEFVSDFGDKTISGHVAYTYRFDNSSGLFQNMSLRGLGVARKLKDDFSYAGNVLLELPKAGWVKVGYDKIFGLNAGFGINLTKNLGIGFSYEKQDNLGGTNEVGILYRLGRNRSRSVANRTPKVDIILPEDEEPEILDVKKNEYEDPEHNDLSDELQVAQDSINSLHKKVDELLRLVKNQPQTKEIVREVPVEQSKEARDQSLPRSKAKPWRERTVTRTGGGAGTMYYTAIEQYKSLARAKSEVKKYNRNKNNKYKARYVRDPKYDVYVVYIDRHAKKEDAEDQKHEINGTTKGVEGEEANNDLGIKKSKTGADKVYVMKITLGAEGESYTEPKPQPPARVRTMKNPTGQIPPGYYLVVNVFGKKAYADKFLDELENDGIKADFFINPETGMRHVYILKTDSRAETIKLYNNNLNGSYYDRKNIVEVK
ncbi:type IX secretion system PorP/SprF family membrane protein [Tenacibaculum skagerrakense]|uniref:Type IX secretion system PorP/SprF family membrane protein n=1 Tax=Tenacibaculum skagerrakense TaxID=186571 RepID=A0A4R2NR92_9FLAO|nr:PorP/SprF family type IX secretion system membrane protein [Tenacibaculum skagerrakense]TCP24439.1 type IX secretion system PorP/SprF family membrane protein [Tenacibaculum skagerrakense]